MPTVSFVTTELLYKNNSIPELTKQYERNWTMWRLSCYIDAEHPLNNNCYHLQIVHFRAICIGSSLDCPRVEAQNQGLVTIYILQLC